MRRPLLLGSAAAVAGLFAWMRCVEPRRLLVREVPVDLSAPAGTPDSARRGALRILHLTDFHLGSDVPLAFIRKACERAVQEGPDLVCLTGDFITDYLSRPGEYAEVLRILSAAAPAFAVTGNHDGGWWARERGGYPTPGEVGTLLRGAGIRWLDNRMEEIEVKGRKVAVAGLGDLWAGHCRPEAVAAALAASRADLRLLLVHNPDVKDQVDSLAWDLLLAGHTHGGQLILPVLGAPFAPVRDKSMIKGLHDWRGRKVHVSPGIGNLHGMRLFSPPEISLLLIPPRTAAGGA